MGDVLFERMNQRCDKFRAYSQRTSPVHNDHRPSNATANPFTPGTHTYTHTEYEMCDKTYCSQIVVQSHSRDSHGQILLNTIGTRVSNGREPSSECCRSQLRLTSMYHQTHTDTIHRVRTNTSSHRINRFL